MSQAPPFRARFEAMVAVLRAHPQVEVFEVVINPPARAADLREAEAVVGSPLPPALRAFYEAHDGVFLEWGLRGRQYRHRTEPFGFPDDGQPPGCINLLPVRAAMSPGWEAHAMMHSSHQELLFGAPLDPQPPVRAVCVDLFSRRNHGNLIFGPDPAMVISYDFGADMDASDWVSVSTYLDMTLAIFGVDRYYCGLGIGGSRAPQCVSSWTAPPDLEGSIRWIEEN